jgi:hypothetical protein
VEEWERIHQAYSREGQPVSKVQDKSVLHGRELLDEQPILRPLVSAAEGDLCWVESREHPCMEFHLLTAEDIVASLTFLDPAALTAVGRSLGEAWVLADEGLLRPRITIRSLTDQCVLAVYRPRLLCLPGVLELVDGCTFHWRRVGFLPATYRFDGLKGQPLVTTRFECCRSWLFGRKEFRGFVEIGADAHMMSDLVPVLLFSWYLITLPRLKERLQLLP